MGVDRRLILKWILKKSGEGVPWIKGLGDLDNWQSVVNIGMDNWVS